LADAVDKDKELSKDLSASSTSKAALKAQLDSLQAVSSTQEEELEKLQDLKDQHESQIGKMQSSLSKQKASERLKSALAASIRQSDRKLKSTLRSDLDSEHSNLVNITKLHAEALQQVAELEDARAELEKTKATLHSELEETQRALGGAVQKLEESEAKNANNLAVLKQCEVDNNEQMTDIARLQTLLADCSAEKESVFNKLGDTERSCQMMEKKLSEEKAAEKALETEKGKLVMQIAAQAYELEALHDTVDQTVKDTIAAQIIKDKTQIQAKIQDQISQPWYKAAVQHYSKDSIEGQFHAIIEEKRSLTLQVKKLTELAESKDEQYNHLARDNKEVRGQLEELQCECAEMAAGVTTMQTPHGSQRGSHSPTASPVLGGQAGSASMSGYGMLRAGPLSGWAHRRVGAWASAGGGWRGGSGGGAYGGGGGSGGGGGVIAGGSFQSSFSFPVATHEFRDIAAEGNSTISKYADNHSKACMLLTNWANTYYLDSGTVVRVQNDYSKSRSQMASGERGQTLAF